MPAGFSRVAVLLAAYNGGEWIEEQISSVLAQVNVDVTLYISVDLSTDNTYVVCRDISRRHSNVVLLPYGDKFGGAARNFFRLIKDVELSGFEFIAFADQDDHWYPDKLHRATSLLRGGECDAYSSNVTAFWPDGRTLLLDKAQPQVAWDFLFEAAGPGCTYVFRKEMAAQLKISMLASWEALQRVTFHDWYCYAFARSHGYKWFIDPLPGMGYRQHERNQVGANVGVSSFITRFKMMQDGWWFTQIRLIASLVGKGNDPFVKRWLKLGRWQLIKLALNGCVCRRRVRDKLLFFFVCCATAVIGSRVK